MPKRERTFASFLACSGDELRAMCVDYNIASVTQLLRFFCLTKPNSRQIMLAREHLSDCGINSWNLPADCIDSSNSSVATYAPPDTSIRPPKSGPPLRPLPMPPKVTKPSRGLPVRSEGLSRSEAKFCLAAVIEEEISKLEAQIQEKRKLLEALENF